jgi:hypothetical protein
MTVIGALSSFRELGKMSPHKRAWIPAFSHPSDPGIVALCRLKLADLWRVTGLSW